MGPGDPWPQGVNSMATGWVQDVAVLPFKGVTLVAAYTERAKVLATFRHYLNRWERDNTAKGTAQESTLPLEHEEASFAFTYVTAICLAQLISRHLPMASSQGRPFGAVEPFCKAG